MIGSSRVVMVKNSNEPKARQKGRVPSPNPSLTLCNHFHAAPSETRPCKNSEQTGKKKETYGQMSERYQLLAWPVKKNMI
jgi:hypothetical protein